MSFHQPTILLIDILFYKLKKKKYSRYIVIDFLFLSITMLLENQKNQMSFHQPTILLIDFLFYKLKIYKLKKRSILDTILPKYDKINFTPLLLFINPNRIFRFLFATLGTLSDGRQRAAGALTRHR